MTIIIGDIFGLLESVYGLLIGMVAGIYKLVDWTYQIFLVLAETNIFKEDDYVALTNKVYVILGILTMFIIAYNILNYIIDPDKNKSGAEVEKLIKKIVTSFILIVLCPTLFSLAIDIQSAIIKQGTFTKFFSNREGFSGNSSLQKGGQIMAGYAFTAFFSPVNGDENIESKGDCSSTGKKCTYEYAKIRAINYGDFGDFYAFKGNLADDKKTIDFNFLTSLVAGGFLIYVTISFCFDLAVRIVKLAFYQIIAPICIACRIIPDKESIFNNWWKAVSKTFLSVFIRIFIMNFGVYLISLFTSAIQAGRSNFCSSCGWVVKNVSYALIIMGIVAFIKQAAKYLDEIFGFGDVSLGIKDKLASGGAFTAGSFIGGAATTFARNATHAASNIKKAEGGWEKTKAVFRGVRSTVHGTVAGGVRGARAGWKAASASDMANAARSGANQTTQRRDEREAYRASHNLGPIKGTTPVIGHLAEAFGHIKDTAFAVGRWAGVNNIEELQADNKNIQALSDDVNGLVDQAKKMIMDNAMKGKKWTLGVDQATAQSRVNTDYSKIIGLAGGSLGKLDFSLETVKRLQEKINESKRTGESVAVDGLSLDDENADGVLVKDKDGNLLRKKRDEITSDDEIQKRKYSAEQLESIFGKYMSDYSKVVSEVMLQGDDHFKEAFFADKDGKIKRVAEEEWKVVSGLRDSAEKAKASMKKNAGSATIEAANTEAIRIAAIKELQKTMSEADFAYDSKSGTITHMSDDAKQRLVELMKSDAIIAKANVITAQKLNDKQTDVRVTQDAAYDKIGNAAGSIINENNTQIHKIQQREQEAKGDKK